MSAAIRSVSVITPVYRNEDMLVALAGRVAAALADRPWRLRFVVDASPDASLAVALRLAATDTRVGVTVLPANVGPHRALAAGLAVEEGATTWVCLDADLQDPPEAVPELLDRLAEGDVAAVFAGRVGRYEGRGRQVTGRLHRMALSRLCDVPPDAGAYVALGPAARDAVVRLGAPSIVAAIGTTGLPVASVPVARALRPSGRSAWRSSARLRQSVETLAWAARERLARADAGARSPHDHRRLGATDQQLRRAGAVGGHGPDVDAGARGLAVGDAVHDATVVEPRHLVVDATGLGQGPVGQGGDVEHA
ncbi:MAG: glycosyltransferase [Acidimicrobiales bacterium]